MVEPCIVEPCDVEPCDVEPCDVEPCDVEPCDDEEPDVEPPIVVFCAIAAGAKVSAKPKAPVSKTCLVRNLVFMIFSVTECLVLFWC